MQVNQGYAFNADHYCAKCLEDNGISKDSKFVTFMQWPEVDSPAHCAECGVPLDCQLTPHGVDYVLDSLKEAMFDLDSFRVVVKRPSYYAGAPRAEGILDDWAEMVRPYATDPEQKMVLELWRAAKEIYKHDL